MLILVTHPDPTEAQHWATHLREALPQSRVRIDAPEAPAHTNDALCAVGWKPPQDFFSRHPDLQAFFCAGAGVDHLLRHPGLPPTLPVIRLEDAGMGALMADYCLHAVLHIAGRWPAYGQQQARQQWFPHAPLSRDALTVGILGLGVLGRQVAQRLHQSGFTVCGYTRTAPAQERQQALDGIEVLHGESGWRRFLERSRVLILLAPLTSETENLIDARALSHLPPGAWLVNVARGALVVDADLIAALDCGSLEGAVLDVFRQEPLPADHPFWHHPRIVMTPHVSAPTQIDCSVRQVAANIRRLVCGEPLKGLVDRQRGY